MNGNCANSKVSRTVWSIGTRRCATNGPLVPPRGRNAGFVHKLGHLRTACGSSVDKLEDAALAAILIYCGTSPPPCSELQPSVDGARENLGPSVDDLGPSVVDPVAIRGRPCGHPWTTVRPSVDDRAAIRGRPCGHPWTTVWPSVDDRVAIRGRPCGHPWTTVWPSVDDRVGHPWTTVWPSVDDRVAIRGRRVWPISTMSTCATWRTSAVLKLPQVGRPEV